eukprot:TRINITY_DN4552_c0_g1_i3.p1 TRINITY_DN4552_c0_g1~~TRINITY_DN4552_c0_g1_i3.p1  ORF type:complete len:414 (-),score=80.28 TRINITY_DN4552_c0_g1_i3:24-1265(-)
METKLHDLQTEYTNFQQESHRKIKHLEEEIQGLKEKNVEEKRQNDARVTQVKQELLHKCKEFDELTKDNDMYKSRISKLEDEQQALLEEALRWEEARQHLVQEKNILERSLKESRTLCDSMISDFKPLKKSSGYGSWQHSPSELTDSEYTPGGLISQFDNLCKQIEDVAEHFMKLKQDISSGAIPLGTVSSEGKLSDFMVQSRITAALIKLQTGRSIASTMRTSIDNLLSQNARLNDRKPSYDELLKQIESYEARLRVLENDHEKANKELEEVYSVGANLQKLLNVATETLNEKSKEATEAQQELRTARENEEKLKQALKSYQDKTLEELRALESSYKQEWSRQVEALQMQEMTANRFMQQQERIYIQKSSGVDTLLSDCQSRAARTSANLHSASKLLEHCRTTASHKASSKS